MELTPRERKTLDAYLRIRPGASAGWRWGVAAGLAVCIAAVVMAVSGIGGPVADYFLVVLMAGLLITETALDHRRNLVVASILRKYEAAIGAGASSAAEQDGQ